MNTGRALFYVHKGLVIGLFSVLMTTGLLAQPVADSLAQRLEKTMGKEERVELMNRLANELRRTYPDSAIAYAQQSLEIGQEMGDSLAMRESRYRMGMVHGAQFRQDESRTWLLKAIGVYRRSGEHEMEGRVANEIGITHGIQGDYKAAESYFQVALESSIAAGLKDKEAECLSNLGNVYKYKGDYLGSLSFYERSLHVYYGLGDSIGIALIYNHLGIIYDYQGIYSRSLEHYFKALRILENTDETGEIAAVLGNIGVAYHLQEDNEKALEYALRQLELERQAGDKRGLSIVLNNIGQYNENLGQLEKALAYHRESLELKMELGLQEGIAASYHNMGTIHSKLGQYPRSLEYQLTSLGIREEIGNLRGISMTCISLATLYRQMEDLQSSNNYALRALEIADELGTPQYIQAASGILAENYAEQSRYRQAFRYQKLHQEMTDSLVDAENIKKVTQLEMQYDFDKQMQEQAFQQEQERIGHDSEMKRQKILTWSFTGGFILVALLAFVILRGYNQKKKSNQLLAEQKEEIQAMNDQLQDSLGEKEILLKEIHHRVKNNLQIISSLLNLQSRNLEDEAIQDAVWEGQSRVKSMALIHQMLYQSEQLSNIPFQDYLEQLSSTLSTMYRGRGEISCRVDAKGIELDIDTAIPLGLIVNELVSNAYKYAFPDVRKGLLEIILQRKDSGEYCLEVRDNGIGIPDGVTPETGSSLGLRLVSILTRQLNGEISFENERGTAIIIIFTEAMV